MTEIIQKKIITSRKNYIIIAIHKNEITKL